MRVLLDTTFARRGPSGTAVYLECVARSLRALGVEVVEAADARRRTPAGGGFGSVRNLLGDGRWHQHELPAMALRVAADVVHHPLPARCWRCPCPQVITVHDLAFLERPEFFSPAFRTWATWTHARAARAADAVVCVSHATAAAVDARWGLAPGRTIVAHHGPGQQLALATPDDRPRHFLYVGDGEPRKNIATLLAAHARYVAATAGPAVPLVLAGRVHASARAVRTVSSPSAVELGSLYAHAVALVHPAAHEGFGLTLLEAMAAGRPVLAAASAAAREVCGDAALYVPREDPAALAAAMGRLAGDRALWETLARRGRSRAQEFSWESSARAHVEAYTLATR